MTVLPFVPDHLRALKLQPMQRWCAPLLTDDLLDSLEDLDGYTGMVDGVPVVCAGVAPLWGGRYMAWSFLSEAAGPHMLKITRRVRAYLDLRNFRRVEAYVDEDFEAGHRWMEALGFVRETPGVMEKFLPSGRGQVLYARVERSDG